MTALLIVLGAFGVVFLLLVLPFTVDLSYEAELCYRIEYAGIVLFDSEKRVDIKKVKRKKSKKSKSNKHISSKEVEPEKQGFFKKLYKEKGFFGTVRYCAELLGIIIKKLWWVVKHFKFRCFKLDLIVATSDAANTALEYGAICCAVYPVLAFIESNANFKPQNINISTDFDKSEPQFQVAFSVTTRLIFWLVAALAVLWRFLKLQRKDCEKT